MGKIFRGVENRRGQRRTSVQLCGRLGELEDVARAGAGGIDDDEGEQPLLLLGVPQIE